MAKIVKIALFGGLLLSFAYLVLFKQKSVVRKIEEVPSILEDVKDTIAPKPTRILKTGLPDRHLIETAFVPQAPEKNWDQPWQDACEEAALLTVHYYYQKQDKITISRIKSDLLDIFKWQSMQGWSHDINISQMATLSAQYWNYHPVIIDNPTLNDIKSFLSQNLPVIIPANGKTLFKENHNFRQGGPYYHNLVILGYNDTKKVFTVHDVGTQYGAYFHYSYDLLLSSIHDFPQTSKKEDIDQGKPKILVLMIK